MEQASDFMDPSAPSGELLTRHSGFLRALARGLLGDEQLAEDAYQEALLATLVPARRAMRVTPARALAGE